MDNRNTYVFQAAKDVQASQGTLADIFENVEMFFRRLEIYTEVRPTTEMMDIIVKIVVALYPWDRNEGDTARQNK